MLVGGMLNTTFGTREKLFSSWKEVVEALLMLMHGADASVQALQGQVHVSAAAQALAGLVARLLHCSQDSPSS